MQTLFCTECGHKMSYAGAKPKFCSSCGTSIGSAPEKALPPPERSSKRKIPSFREQMEGKQEEEPYDSDGGDWTDIDELPQIQGLQYTISDDGVGNKTYNLDELIDVSSKEEVAPKPKAKRGRPRKKTKQ